ATRRGWGGASAQDLELDPAIDGATLLGRVVAAPARIAVGGGLDALGADAAEDELLGDAAGAVRAEAMVGRRRALLVRVADDAHADGGLRAQELADLAERRAIAGGHAPRAEPE